MAPDKFEKHIRETIKEREIAPSEDAWNRIAELIPVEERKRSRPLLRYSLAASFAALLIISLYLIQSREEVGTPPVQVVETEQQLKEEPRQDKLLPEVVPNAEEEQVASQVISQPEEEKVNEVVPETNNSLAIVAPVEAPVTQDKARSGEEIPLTDVKQQEDVLIQAKITEVVAEVRLLEANSEALTEAEVDSLLRKAQTEILKERIFTTGNSVDALALLNEVEEELDQSFRDQLFERLKAGFMKVRTAVADRNN